MPKSGYAVTEEHKAKLALGREEGRIVRRYLEALENQTVQRGRPQTVKGITAQLKKLEAEFADESSPVARLNLAQKRIDLKRALEELSGVDDLKAAEDAFVRIVRGYSERKGISYQAWREIGVPAAVLDRAGVKR